ncbi:MAG: hypothetical protein ACK52C_13575 [Planctomycetia bacterium]
MLRLLLRVGQFPDPLLRALLRLSQLLDTLLRALLRLSQLLDALLCALLRLRQFPDMLLRPLLGLSKFLLRSGEPFDNAPELGEVVPGHELVVHFHVKVCNELRLIGGKRRLETVSDFREADHGVAAPRTLSIIKYPPFGAAGQADRSRRE